MKIKLSTEDKLIIGILAATAGLYYLAKRKGNVGPILGIGEVGDKYFFVAKHDLNYEGKPPQILWLNSKVFDSFKKAPDGSRTSDRGRYLYERVSQTKAREIIAFNNSNAGKKDVRSKRGS